MQPAPNRGRRVIQRKQTIRSRQVTGPGSGWIPGLAARGRGRCLRIGKSVTHTEPAGAAPPCQSVTVSDPASNVRRAHRRRYDRPRHRQNNRFHCVPNGCYGARAAKALGQALACLAHRCARPAGGGADVGDRGEQGVLAQVVGLPPGDLLKQVRFGAAMDGRCSQHCVLELVVFPAAEGALGQEPVASVQGKGGQPGWPGTSSARPRRRAGAPRPESVVSRVQGRKLAHQLGDVSVAGEPVEQDTVGGHGVLGSGALPGSHAPTVGAAA